MVRVLVTENLNHALLSVDPQIAENLKRSLRSQSASRAAALQIDGKAVSIVRSFHKTGKPSVDILAIEVPGSGFSVERADTVRGNQQRLAHRVQRFL